MKRQFARIAKTFILLVCILSFYGSVFGQDQTNVRFTQGSVGDGGSLSFGIPLGNFPGRGISLPVGLSYSSSVWRIQHHTVIRESNHLKQSVAQALYSEYSTAGWTSSLGVPQIEWPRSDEVYDPKGRPAECCTYNYRVARVTIHMPNGSTHEFRKSDYYHTGGIDVSGIFFAVDGSRMKYVSSDADTGYLYLPDGTNYYLDAGSCLITDARGNSVSYSASTHQWTDTVGRTLPNPLAAAPVPDEETYYTLPGLSGVNSGQQVYILRWKYLNEVLTPDENNDTPELRYIASHYLPDPGSMPSNAGGTNYPQPQSSQHQSLFASAVPTSDDPPEIPVETMVLGPGQSGGAFFNPVVLGEIQLPDGSIYKFSYNVYGEIDKILYPTGAYEKYAYDTMLSYQDGYRLPYVEANRKVASRVQSISGQGDDLLEWTYSQTQAGNGDRTTSIIAPDKTRTEIVKYDFPEPGDNAGKQYWPLGLADSRNGMIFEERFYSTSTNGLGGSLLRRELTKYEQTSNAYTYNAPGISPTYVVHVDARRNVRPVKKVSLLFEGTGPALAQASEFIYDNTNEFTTGVDQTVSKVYNYAAVNNSSPTDLAQAGAVDSSAFVGALVKYTEISYLNDSSYQLAYIFGLPASVTVKDGVTNAPLSRSEMIYDESTLTYDGAARGLPTSQTVWDSSKGSSSDPNNYLVTHAKFDQWGNRIEATDAKGNVTTTAYDPTHHTYPETMTSAVPDQNGGTYGSTSAFTSLAEFDYTTGLVLSTTDANSQTTTMEYNDLLLRPTKITASNGQQTITEYGMPDGSGIFQSGQRFVHVKTQTDTTHWSEAYSWFDGAGRTYQTKKIDALGDIFTDTEFDDMGRVKRSTNPYRTGETPRWTSPTYDDLSRTTKITLPDPTSTPTTVQVTYGLSTSGVLGTTKTITDQAGRKRKGIVDALGNMVRVVEDPDGDNLVTDYVFDKMGNLRKTAQGSQNRYFRYDSLGRVIYARQVEQDANANFSGANYADPITGNDQWSVRYQYDDNGNISSITDARNKTINAAYDHLNRLTVRDYSDTAMPDVHFYFDGKGLDSVPGFSKGQTTRVSSSVSETRYTSFDGSGNLLSSQQITDGNTYNFSYGYNLSNTLIREVYPSGRVVQNDLSSDGRLTRVSSSKNSTSGLFPYLENVTYNSQGLTKSLQLGNGYWESTAYNERQQVSQIALGTTNESSNLLKLEFAYTSMNAHDNNGSLREQKITVPTIGGANGFTATQTYIYDSLNRIKSTAETIGGSPTWKQTFNYDLYGNRTFDTTSGATTTLGSCQQVTCNPTVNTANNRFSSGQYYSYDANGNLTSNPDAWTFNYDSENHQTEVKDDEGLTKGLYYYDGDGRRVKKITDDETTIFVYDASGKLTAEYSTKLAETPQVNYLTMDHLGSARITTGAGGGIVSRKDFSAFGEKTITAQRTEGLGYAPDEVRQDYTGYQKDAESGLEFAQARYYNSQHGRFTSVDPLAASGTIKDPQTFNRYSYSLNNPYKFTDPLGLTPNSCGTQQSSCEGGTGSGSSNIDEAMAAHDKRVKDIQTQQKAQAAANKGDLSGMLGVLEASGNPGDFVVKGRVGDSDAVIKHNGKYWIENVYGKDYITDQNTINLLNTAINQMGNNIYEAIKEVRAINDLSKINTTSSIGGSGPSATHDSADQVLRALVLKNNKIYDDLITVLSNTLVSVPVTAKREEKVVPPDFHDSDILPMGSVSTTGAANLAIASAMFLRRTANELARQEFRNRYPNQFLPYQFFQADTDDFKDY